MLFILKEYDRWKMRLLEIYGSFSSSSSQKEKKIYGCLKNVTIGNGNKINKDLNIIEKKNKEYVGFEK